MFIRHFSKNIPTSVRMQVWGKYIGLKHGLSNCWCCKTIPISQFNFECGHVVSRKDNGLTNIENLRPICGLCNKSMGTENMLHFMKKYDIK